MIEYSEKLMRYFLKPRFVGEIEDADSIGQIGDVECGDFLKLWIKVENEVISDIRFKCFGCPAAIATSEALCELALNKKLDEAGQITDEMVVEYLLGLPEEKIHCSNLGSSALKKAIEGYKEKMSIK